MLDKFYRVVSITDTRNSILPNIHFSFACYLWGREGGPKNRHRSDPKPLNVIRANRLISGAVFNHILPCQRSEVSIILTEETAYSKWVYLTKLHMFEITCCCKNHCIIQGKPNLCQNASFTFVEDSLMLPICMQSNVNSFAY